MKSTDQRYFSRLDHLRFIAAMLVLGWHTVHLFGLPFSYVPSIWPLSFIKEGHTGVALFMTLSGFIFHALCRDKNIAYSQFIKNRLLRIAPLFLVWALIGYSVDGKDPLKIALAVGALLNNSNVLGSGWTIVVEFQYYLILPFLIIFFRNYGIRYLACLVLLAMALRAGVWLGRGTVESFAYWTIFGRIDQFLLGMIGCELFFRYSKRIGSPIVLIVILVTWCTIYHYFNVAGGFMLQDGQSTSPIWIILPTLEGVFYALITAAYLALDVRIPLLIDKGVAWLGTLSFSIYLNHEMVISIARRLFAHEHWNVAQGLGNAMMFSYLVCAPLVILISVATFYLIERPFLSLRRSYALPKKSQAASNISMSRSLSN